MKPLPTGLGLTRPLSETPTLNGLKSGNLTQKQWDWFKDLIAGYEDPDV